MPKIYGKMHSKANMIVTLYNRQYNETYNVSVYRGFASWKNAIQYLKKQYPDCEIDQIIADNYYN